MFHMQGNMVSWGNLSLPSLPRSDILLNMVFIIPLHVFILFTVVRK